MEIIGRLAQQKQNLYTCLKNNSMVVCDLSGVTGLQAEANALNG